MERFQHVPDEDVSSSGEADPKRQKSDNSGSTKRKRESKLKNVVVLLGDDVRKEDGKVYMLNRPETAQLKKPELGQLKSKIKFTETMTEKNVEEELRQNFPILRDNGRFSCASAADNRTRLEFHNSPGTVWNGSGTVWDGTKIKRLITGNAVLYVLSEVRRSVESNNSSDSAFESTTGNASGVDDNTEHSTVITKLCPKEGPIMGGTQFVICLNVKSIPENLTSLKATFKEVGVVDLTPVTAGVHSGCSPASKTLGKVAVTVGSPDGTWNSPEETEFEYYPGVTQEFQKLIAKMPDTKRNIPLDYQTLNPSRSAGTVCSPSSFSSVVDTSLMADESKDILSLKALKGILFAAAAANDRECIETIFSTSAGEAVFQTYRNSSILPENTARAMGHKDLAEYLQNIHKRLSEEIVCNVQTVTIDWVELKHATAKKDICSGTDESQGLELEGFLESDDDQTNYFADDETSICQSPSASEFEDECIESKSTADVYRNEGNEAFKKGDFINAIHFYTKGIKMNCNEKELKAKLYNNRAMAHFKLGNPRDSLRDAEAAIELNPTFLKAIVRGAAACVELKRFEEAITWCDKGLAIDKNNRILSSLRLQSVSEVGDKSMEEKDPISLDHGCASSGDFKKVIGLYNWEEDIEDLNLHLKKAKEVGDKHGKGGAYGNLGNAYGRLGDFKKAIEYHNLHLKIAKEVGDKHGEGGAYGNLGNAYVSLGEFKKAIEYHNLALKIAKEVGDKHGEGGVYGNFGIAYRCLGDFKKAMEYHNLHLKIAKEVGDKHGEGGVYGNLGIAYQGLGELKKAIEYHNLHLKIAKEVGDKHREGSAYGNLGNAYVSLGEFKKAIEYHNLALKIAKEVGDKSFEAMAYYSLGHVFELQGGLPKAVEYYEASINLFDSLRELLKSKDEWKVNFRNQHQMAYTGLWRVLVEQGNVDEALFVAEKGRAQALTDLMESSFCGGTSHHKGEDEDFTVLKNVPSNTVFQAVDKANVNLWVVSEGNQVRLRQSKLKGFVSENSGVSQSFESFMLGVYTQLGVRSNVRCENRSLDALREGRSKVDEKTKEANPQPHIQQDGCLSTLYDIVMKPVADLIEGDELLIIPDGPLWIAPYAALKDGNSKYLCESFTIRVAPSLASVRLIADCPDDYHKSSGALLVGDPWVSEVTNSEGEKVLEQLPCAKEEVEMIGKILNITPITGRQATKREVFKRLSSVSLVHFAAHGCPETGEIALTPDLDRISTVPTEKEDYILTIRDVLNVQLRAKLVVLSCCHSGRGEIKAEGVVGIARAFMGAGARSVVVSLWAIDDEATLQFMKCFYQHLAEGKPTSKSLNLAMKSLRESDEFHEIKYWAPFLLIGDDVTFDLMAKERENLNRKSNK